MGPYVAWSRRRSPVLAKGEGIMAELQQNAEESKNGWGTCWENWDEESWEEWWRSDRLDSIGWAVIFFWGALVLLAEGTGFAANFAGWYGWGVFFTGAGIIVLLEAVVRLLVPEYHRHMISCLIFGTILLSIGMGGLGGWFWALILIIIGSTVPQRALAHRS